VTSEQLHGIENATLHYLLWTRRSTPTTVSFKQITLAAELRVAPPDISRLVARLVHDGRLAKTSTQGVYRITDPADWTAEMVGTNPRQLTR
jgi:DNA-binding MarR family transcriptional regulator